jgi:hypothetical protein
MAIEIRQWMNLQKWDIEKIEDEWTSKSWTMNEPKEV